MQFLIPHMRVVDQVAFAHDGRRLFAAGSNVPALRYKPDNRGIDVWDLPAAAKPAERLFANELITGFAVNPAGRWLYVGTGFPHPDASASGYWVVDLTTGASSSLGLSAGNGFILGVHPSGDWLAGYGHLTDWQTNRLVRWRQPPSAAPVKDWELKPQPARHYTCHIACDPNGTRLFTREIEMGTAVPDQVYELAIRDPTSGKPTQHVPIPGRTVDQLLFSPDGSWLVLRGGPSLFVWDAGDLTRKPQKIHGGVKGHFTGLAFHPTGRYLAATSNDQTVTVYNTAAWQVATTYTWDIGRMRSVAFSPDGALAAAGSDTGRIVLWDIDL
jgi:WD40 repeat protein